MNEIINFCLIETMKNYLSHENNIKPFFTFT